MFDTLIASGARGTHRRPVPGATLAVLVHVAVVAAAAWATLRPKATTAAARPPILIDWPWPDQTDPRAPGGPSEPIPGAPGRLVDLPIHLPIGLPPIDLGTALGPTSLAPAVDRTPAGAAPGMDPGDPWSLALVEEPPALLAAPPPVYPELLRRAGIAGRVVVEAVIDTVGRAERPSVRVVASPNAGFDAPARDCVLRARFRPARVHGRAVRVLIQVPIDFRIVR
ncbi:MAG TPA: energy transducer TonB [Gemmatimonadales bacterium]|nr:energy transducer TonB [Gemmatimonadales bacterium]